MPSAPKAQLHCRIDPDLKDWLGEYALAAGREIGEIVEDLLDECRQKAGGKSPRMEEKLEKQLNQVDEELSGLENEKNKGYMRLRRIAFDLAKAYPNLERNFNKIRLKALQDFKVSKPAWAREEHVENESDVIAACRIAGRLIGLRAKKKDLETQLREIYGMEEEAPATQRPSEISTQAIADR